MPNVKGLDPAPILVLSLNKGQMRPYGPHCTVTLTDTTVTLINDRSRVIATVDFATNKPRVRATLSQIDGDSVTAVNALLRPYGKVKQYWRTEEYRWHPNDGPASPVKGRGSSPKAPSASPFVPKQTVVITPTAGKGSGVAVIEDVDDEALPPVAPQAPVVVAHHATNIVIETVKRWQDRGGKRPVSKQVTKTYSIVDDIFVPSVDVESFDYMKRQRDAGVPSFGLITGPAGTAKTSFAQAWAFVNDLPVVIVEGQSIQTASDWFGSLVPNTEPGAAPFVWEWSDMAKLVLTGQPCLIVLDELNRPENERALNGIMGLTDWKATVKPVGAPHAITLKPGQCIAATLNEGPEYVGTVEVDAAVRDRFDGAAVVMDYPPEAVEVRILMRFAPGIDKEVAKRLVRVANGQRVKRDDDLLYPSHNVLSPRAMVTIGRSVALGRDPKAAIWATAKTRFIREDWPALGALIEAQFGADPAPIDDSLADDDEIDQMMTAHGF